MYQRIETSQTKEPRTKQSEQTCTETEQTEKRKVMTGTRGKLNEEGK
jgi:hypothetical protein